MRSIGRERPFGTLYPHLLFFARERVDARTPISTRLRNVLKAWLGLRWAPYLAESPATLGVRRQCGVAVLGEFGWLATRLEKEDPDPDMALRPEPEPEPEPDTAGPTERDADRLTRFPMSVVEDLQVLAAVRVIAAWGRHERGGLGLRASLELAASIDDPPSIVRSAIDRLDDIDPSWADPIAEQFDVNQPLSMAMARLDPRQLAIVERRTLTLDLPDTLQELADSFDCSRERIRQIEGRLVQRFRSIMEAPDTSARRLSTRLSDGLGAAWPLDQLTDMECLRDPGLIDVDRLETKLALWAPGPFERVGGWLVRRPARKVIDGSTSRLRRATARGPAPLQIVGKRLEALGVRPAVAERWIATRPGFEVADGVVVRADPD